MSRTHRSAVMCCQASGHLDTLPPIGSLPRFTAELKSSPAFCIFAWASHTSGCCRNSVNDTGFVIVDLTPLDGDKAELVTRAGRGIGQSSPLPLEGLPEEEGAAGSFFSSFGGSPRFRPSLLGLDLGLEELNFFLLGLGSPSPYPWFLLFRPLDFLFRILSSWGKQRVE